MTNFAAPRGVVALFAVGFLANGCASGPPEEEFVRLKWPQPPETTRIEFVRTISSDQDLGAETTFSQQVIPPRLRGVTWSKLNWLWG